MNCRHCGRPVHEVPPTPPNVEGSWVHAEDNGFPCRDADGKMTLDAAEPSRGRLLDQIAAARDDYEGAYGLMEAARDRRDRLIRDAMQDRVSPQDIADASGLKVARVYQIRDGRR